MTTRRPKTQPAAPVLAPASVPAVPVAPSLPPAPADGSLSTSTQLPSNKYALPKRSLLRKKALAIVALKAAGYTVAQIAAELHMTPGSIRTYTWRAMRAGFLVGRNGQTLLDDPMERVEQLTQTALDNYGEMLKSTEVLERGQKSVKMEATFNLMGVYKDLNKPTGETTTQLNALRIEIVMPTSGKQEARAGSMGGTPQGFIDIEPLK